MHELSIATQIVEILETDLADQSGRILSVRLDVGVLSGVVPDALEFAWDLATEHSRLAGSRLEINEIPIVAHCPKCDEDRTLPSIDRLRCPVCNEWTPVILSGQELQIRAVEMSGTGIETPAGDDAAR